eukprot:CAMPEP_0205829692 /NCGR_PEP_ID=MMETSP0206-20130828/38900_1 /ASSEMBLY_ACC=CAM_ASM_000279 /TAXON_ID=36767 /ORGANISM="Euplotes focardii, Strain TN1" /LENGTH=235 /DNA_ID=CAMNT_0053132643 /DNA_START=32 /DNA_END=737 /DNA_ORIENTATION=+
MAEAQPEEKGDGLLSDEAYRQQFNRSNPNFHAGDPTSVPLGGQRVPESMKAHADWMSLPVVESAPVDPAVYGEKYLEAEKTRKGLGKLKKAVAAVQPPAAGVKRHQTVMIDADEAKKKKLDAAIKREQKKLDKALAALKVFLADFPEDSQWGTMIMKICDDQKPGMTDKEHQNWMGYAKKQAQRIFREQKALLGVMKAEKKRYAAEVKAKADAEAGEAKEADPADAAKAKEASAE